MELSRITSTPTRPLPARQSGEPLLINPTHKQLIAKPGILTDVRIAVISATVGTHGIDMVGQWGFEIEAISWRP